MLGLWRETPLIFFKQKCHYIILGDTCDRSLHSFVCDIVTSKQVVEINPTPCHTSQKLRNVHIKGQGWMGNDLSKSDKAVKHI